MNQHVIEHECDWKPMPGPDYDYRPNQQMWRGEKAYVRCTGCGARTWLSREEVARYAAHAAHPEEPND